MVTSFWRLRVAGSLDLGDWLTFAIEHDADMPEIAGQGMVYDGYRFRAEASLGGKLYGDPFGVDIGFADVLTAEPDLTQGSSFFEFAGIEPATFRLYPRHAHIAEKLHAYTMPRDRTNTRVKDLPDIALLASVGPLDALELQRAIDATFSFRATHAVPEAVPTPASEWAPVYERMVREDELPWATLAEVHRAAASFLDHVLRGRTRILGSGNVELVGDVTHWETVGDVPPRSGGNGLVVKVTDTTGAFPGVAAKKTPRSVSPSRGEG